MKECDGGDGRKYVVRMEFNDNNEIVHVYFRLIYACLKLQILHWVSLNN